MTNPSPVASPSPSTSSPGSPPPSGSPVPSGPTMSRAAVSTSLESSQGKTTVADTVVSKIAGLATREISGVYALGGGAARAFGSIRERIPGGSTNASQGVTVEVGEKQAAVDLDIVVEYGAAIVDIASAIRRNVIGALERMTGLEVVEVNIAVNDVHLPDEDRGGQAPLPPSPPRVA
jgi:uncharacterized alkaline shock family protein YloU